MRKIFVGAGHSNTPGRDMGASGNGYIEGNLTVEFRDKLVKELKKLGANVTVDKNDSVFWETINKFKTLVDTNSIVVDIHFNAAVPAATGTETLIPEVHTKFERELAEKVSTVIGETLNIPLRGRKGVKTEAESHHGRLGWMRLNGENILLEICFITNSNDMISYCEKENELAEKIARVLYNASLEEYNDPKNEYVVQPGDYLGRIALKNNTSVKELKRINGLTGDTIYIGQILKLRDLV